MRFVVLGSGTSTGVPSVACDCDTCRSTDQRDKRLRTSLLIQSESTTVLIDTSTDFRQQMLANDVMAIDGIVYTHHHFDHIGGFDDIRPFNFRAQTAMKLYAMNETVDVLKSTFPYAFGLEVPTGPSIPNAEITTIDDAPFSIGDIDLTPIPLIHGNAGRVNGYRIGDFAYCTDTNHIPSASMELLGGLDTLILDGLRWHKHPTHFNVQEALEVVQELKPRVTYLTHIAHQLKHEETEQQLPSNVRLAFDGLVISL